MLNVLICCVVRAILFNQKVYSGERHLSELTEQKSEIKWIYERHLVTQLTHLI